MATTTAVLLAYGRLVLAAPVESSSDGWRWWWRGRPATTTTTTLPLPRACALSALLLLWLHLARRLGECALLTRWPAGARMHGLAYLFSIR